MNCLTRLFALLCFFSLPLAYADLSESKGAFEIDSSDLKIPALAFGNRAACANDSKLPTQIAFLVVDGYNAGKLIDSYLKGLPPEQSNGLTPASGLKLFRLSLAQTWMSLAQELLKGRLPLLQASPDDAHLEANYAKVLATCGKKFPCDAMDQYLATIFSAWKTQAANVENPYSSYFAIDHFSKRPELLKNGRTAAQASCLYVKRFSEMQANWNHDRPDQALLQKIALASLVKQDLFTDCFSDSDDLPSRRFVLQMDISDAQKNTWKEHGYDFWYSLKLYFSYAWRHPELILKSDHPLVLLFKNLAVEQMMTLSSADCRSIDRPECSQSQVSLDLFRALGKMGVSTEVDRPMPDRPEQTLLSKDPALHRDDEAVLPENEDSQIWIKSYQDRILQRRGLMKQRLLLAISQFELLSGAMGPERISEELLTLKASLNQDPVLYGKMLVLCSEIDQAVRPIVGLLADRFDSTLQIKKFKNLVEGSSDQQLGQMIAFYKSIANTAFPVCEQIRAEKLWQQTNTLQTTAYSDWYRDLSGTWAAPVTQQSANTPVAKSDLNGMGEVFNTKSASIAAPFLMQQKINADGDKEQKLICSDASDCVRMLLKSMVDLYAVSAWADALMPLNEWIQSPNLANPWTSATACKVYDPWFATKAAFTGLVTDLVSTSVSGVAPIPAYLAANKRATQVGGFALVPQGDEMYLKPIQKGGGVDYTVGIDLGPWLGIPCAVVASPTANRPSINGFYAIAGVQGSVCSGKDTNQLIVQDASASNTRNQKHVYSGCAMCYLNPYAAANTAAKIASYAVPGLRIAVGAVFSGVNLVKHLNNPVDVPKRYEVNVDEVAYTFKKYSFIPKGCVKRLSKGKSCHNTGLNKQEKAEHQP